MTSSDSEQNPNPNQKLFREVAHFQIKLWLEALRDVVLIPATLIAAALDLALSRQQKPRYFRDLIEMGRRSDEWIDPWAKVASEVRPTNADAVLDQIETLLRDPKSGSRRARVLMRWAERSLKRQQRTPRDSIPPPPPPASAS